jgi:hypothetical protein
MGAKPFTPISFQVWKRDCTVTVGGVSMSFGLYVCGFLVMIVGLAIAANLLHVPPRWIGTGVVVLVGVGIVTGVAKTRQRDSSS